MCVCVCCGSLPCSGSVIIELIPGEQHPIGIRVRVFQHGQVSQLLTLLTTGVPFYALATWSAVACNTTGDLRLDLTGAEMIDAAVCHDLASLIQIHHIIVVQSPEVVRQTVCDQTGQT